MTTGQLRTVQQCGAVVVMAFGLACSDESSMPRDSAAAGAASVPPATMGTAGTTGNGSTTTPGGVDAPGGDGVSTTTPPLTPSLPAGTERGEALEFVASTGVVPYAIGPNEYGISGGGFLARSALGNTITVGTDAGKICNSGNLEEVPLNPDGHGNYGQYWGVEFGFNLNQVPADGGGAALTAPPAPSDAGVDGGAPPLDAVEPWHPGKVVGFSFVIEGPTINLVRFKSLPEGYDSSLESSVFCKEVQATSGGENVALFSELSTFCWGGINTLIPTAEGLANISWQLPADVAPVGARPFDWCLSDLRPIVSTP
ncbi:MAG TPA: hypothetical protein VMG12_33980 [Polyangiaceae bacterium]|nr:hypothetical protein [Polyangiaceae bacterium]